MKLPAFVCKHSNSYVLTLCILLKGIFHKKFSDCKGSWISNSLCNQCISPLNVVSSNPVRWGVFDITLCDKVCQWLVAGRWFSLVTFTNKFDCHISKILLKMALNTSFKGEDFLEINQSETRIACGGHVC